MDRKRMTLIALFALTIAIVAFVGAVTTPVQAFFNCKIVQCPAPQCEDNEHLAWLAGQCCPVCVPN